MKRFVKFFSFVALFVLVHEFCDTRTDGFCLQKILGKDIPQNKSWDVSSLVESEDIHKRLSQPYHFLGMGSECFTFLSEDKQTVIKFFKLDQMRFVYFKRAWSREDHSDLSHASNQHWLHKMPCPSFLQNYRDRILGIRYFRILNTFTSSKIAWDHFKEETGLIYLHLNPTDDLHKTLTIYDKLGIRHEVDLDTTHFLLQQRADLVEETFKKLHKQGSEEQAKECIDSLIHLIVSRCQKGIFDRDPIIEQNFGFIGNKAIEIDVGSFSLNPEVQKKAMILQTLHAEILPLQTWLKEKRYVYLENYLQERLKHISFQLNEQ